MLYTVLVVWSNIAAACKAHFGLGSLTAFIEITSGKGCSVHLLSPLTNTALHVRFKNVAASSPEPHRLGKKKRSKLFIFIFFLMFAPQVVFLKWKLPHEVFPVKTVKVLLVFICPCSSWNQAFFDLSNRRAAPSVTTSGSKPFPASVRSLPQAWPLRSGRL